MKFSQRIGKSPVREKLQIESIDKALENKIWNTIINDFFNQIDDVYPYGSDSERGQVCKYIWEEFYNERSDEVPRFQHGTDSDAVLIYIKEWFFSHSWFDKYDLAEFIAFIDDKSTRKGFTKNCNKVLKKEMSGYRIINSRIVQITDEEEVAEIEEAINSNSKEPYVIHLNTALDFLSNRENPDYRNSVKESISAVESFCVAMTGNNATTLGQALTLIEKRHKLHGALKNAFSALYGYTSDSGGIRHSLINDDIIVTMEDAKFMLVSCSAFINYLRMKQ